MAERLAIIDYGSGNLRSAAKALERAAADLGRELTVSVTGDARLVAQADRVVLPGVGAFGQCATALRSIAGMEAALQQAVIEGGRPFLGICVGMQLMARRGLEHGLHQGLGWVPGDVVRLSPSDPRLKVPHMGWNKVAFTEAGRAHPVLARLENDGFAYFVHSYHLEPEEPAHVLARTDYGGPVTAVVGRDNLLGTQFHPEKSQDYGLALLRAFLEWKP